MPSDRTQPRPILVAEPDADTRGLYRESLASVALEIIEAEDGRDALVKALTRTPALVIAELRLPAIDGFALCDVLRRDRQTHDMPILIVTAEPRLGEIMRAAQLGATLVLSKPVDVAVVVEAAARLYGMTHREAQPPGDPSAPAKRTSSRAFQRFYTTTPPRAPRPLNCPTCDQPLDYRKSRIGGVTPRDAEQWDELHCPELCGVFEYRHRTRTLRLIS